MDKIKEKLDAHGIGLSLAHTATLLPDDGERYNYHCRLLWGGRVIWQGPYFKGLGHGIETKRADGKYLNKRPPGVTLGDLLEALHCDAMSWESSPAFEDFCREFGYSSDSREALRVHDECRKAYLALREVPHLFDLLCEVMEEA